MTSFDVCFRLRKILGTKKIGHTGTLDPLATGVMVILFGKATKANQFLSSDRKTYCCRVLLGIETDTLDIEGNVTGKGNAAVPDEKTLKETLDSLLGKSVQEVPLTSAVSVEGKRLYQYQREGKEVEVPSREINVYTISLNEIHEDGFTYSCEVSSGTYIRALTRDILKKLDLVGTVKELARMAVDDIVISDCDKLSDVLEGRYHAHSLCELLSKRYQAVEYDDIKNVLNGKRIRVDSTEERVLIVHDNEAYAIYERSGDEYRCVRGLF